MTAIEKDQLVIGFGSKARGEADCYSDSDVLVISNEECQKSFTGGALNITLNSAIYSSQDGSLFLNHVFNEGKLLKGSREEFQKLKSSWLPASNYNNEIEENIELLRLLEFLPSTSLAITVAVDIVICVLRSVLIRSFANDGIYIFSWSSMAQLAAKTGKMESAAVPLIAAGRRIKSTYRNQTCACAELPFLNVLVESCKGILGNVHIRFASDRDILNLPEHCKEKSYKQLRALELVRAFTPTDSEIKKWSQWIAKPRLFSSECGY